MRFILEIFKDNELLVSGEMMYVHADSRVRKSVPVPQDWREILVRFEKAHPVNV
jgi:acyl-CoA thioester hydrolase